MGRPDAQRAREVGSPRLWAKPGALFFVVVERDVFVLGGVSGQQILNDEFFDSLTSVVTTGADTNLLLEFMNISFMNQLVA